MLKYLYKGIILLCIFGGSVYYFGRDIKEEVFNTDKTVQMSETSFPIITLRLGEEEINLLHGYSDNLNANIVRESITPLDSDQSFVVVIDEKENEVKRVIYELRSVDNNKLLETDTINALEKEDERKTAKIKFKTELKEGLEYAVKVTLVTSESRKMNYYTRIKMLASSNYEEKIKFVMDFHNAIMDKKKAKNIKSFLEPQSDADNHSLSYVNIHSSLDLISWNNLKPQMVGDTVATVKEISTDMASIELKYKISAETENGLEYYYIKEFYRVRYASSHMYLLNYDRTMESVFDIELTSLSRSELKIGITNQSDIDIVTSADHNKLAFVSQRDLWYYNLAENLAVKVFSFGQEDSDNVRDTYAEHNVKILNMDDDGNFDFVVYGYMNRGVYEGHVGIVLYKFHSAENRIEELVYIPVNVTYQLLKEQLDNFSYVNQLEIYYFTINNKIYAYNLITKRLTVIAPDIDGDSYVVSKEQKYIAWQDSSNPAKATNIMILDLETGKEQKITASKGTNINLLGKIDNNIIYGYVKTKDITTTVDGSILVPMYQIKIADSRHKVLKEYSKKGFYVTGAKVRNNVIKLERVVKVNKDSELHYEIAESDNILNKGTVVMKAIGLTNRVMEETLTELYISLPSGFSIETKPKFSDTINTIITEDTTLRLEEEEIMTEQYITYASGEIEGIYENAGDAINQANTLQGVVLNKKQHMVWERSIKNTRSEIEGITPIFVNGEIDSVLASAQMIINHKNGSTNQVSSSSESSSAYELLSKNIGESVLNLTGCSLGEVLYYVNKDRPVLAMKDQENAVLIIGYDEYNITVIDPSLHQTMKVGLLDGAKMFKEAGNIFVSYVTENE